MIIEVSLMKSVCKNLLEGIDNNINELNKVCPEDDGEANATTKMIKKAKRDRKIVENELLILDSIKWLRYEPSNYDIKRILIRYGYIAFL